MLFAGIKNLFSEMSEVCVGWFLVDEFSISPDIAFTHNYKSFSTSKRILDIVDRLKEYFRIVS
jgi:hypothetical protein